MSRVFRFATQADAPAVRQLLLDCGLPNEDIHEHLDHFVVAERGRELAGVIGLQVLGRIGQVPHRALYGHAAHAATDRGPVYSRKLPPIVCGRELGVPTSFAGGG